MCFPALICARAPSSARACFPVNRRFVFTYVTRSRERSGVWVEDGEDEEEDEEEENSAKAQGSLRGAPWEQRDEKGRERGSDDVIRRENVTAFPRPRFIDSPVELCFRSIQAFLFKG